jgi:hypothetical protein
LRTVPVTRSEVCTCSRSISISSETRTCFCSCTSSVVSGTSMVPPWNAASPDDTSRSTARLVTRTCSSVTGTSRVCRSSTTFLVIWTSPASRSRLVATSSSSWTGTTRVSSTETSFCLFVTRLRSPTCAVDSKVSAAVSLTMRAAPAPV